MKGDALYVVQMLLPLLALRLGLGQKFLALLGPISW